MKSWTKALPLLARLFSGSALAEPKDLQQIPEVDPPEVQEEQEQKKKQERKQRNKNENSDNNNKTRLL